MEREILKTIDNSSNVLIITHINPDGDTLGCASALKSFIGQKADILIQINDNFDFPATYSFLPYLNNAVNFSTLEDKYDLIISLDCAAKDRIIGKAKEIFEKTNNIVIDHHKTNKGYGKLNYIQGGKSSCAEVLYNIFEKLNIKITEEMAIGMYAGVLTDTGCFKYESTTQETFKMAQNLAQTGIDTSQIADLCYHNKSKNLVLFQNHLIANTCFCLNDKIAYTLITKEIFEKYKAKDYYTEGICEELRSISTTEVAFVLKENPNGIKISIRTKSIDATKIAQSFNGGGHQRAAGCTIKGNINQALEKLLEVTKELV